MSGCTPTDKPLISILMAVYEPREDWLREQLVSLESQTYPHLKLYIRDDASPGFPFERLEALVKECIRSFPAELSRSGENAGSNAVFAALTAEAEGEYFAFCDQDDIWLPEKLTVLASELERQDALLVCSDQRIIDEAGNTVTDSISELRRHHVFRSGTGLGDTLWKSNFASGCAMLVKAAEAKAALPWNPHMVYDHYITLWCGDRGVIVSLPDALVLHREHADNQSTLLRGVEDKESYYRIRVENKLRAVRWLREHFPATPKLSGILARAEAWLDARERYSRGEKSAAGAMWRERALGKKETVFELILPVLPDAAVRAAVELGRKNKI